MEAPEGTTHKQTSRNKGYNWKTKQKKRNCHYSFFKPQHETIIRTIITCHIDSISLHSYSTSSCFHQVVFMYYLQLVLPNYDK